MAFVPAAPGRSARDWYFDCCSQKWSAILDRMQSQERYVDKEYQAEKRRRKANLQQASLDRDARREAGFNRSVGNEANMEMSDGDFICSSSVVFCLHTF